MWGCAIFPGGGLPAWGVETRRKAAGRGRGCPWGGQAPTTTSDGRTTMDGRRRTNGHNGCSTP